MSDLPTQDDAQAPRPLDEQFYVRLDSEIVGPISGFQLVKMIETGRATARTNVMRLGEEWTELARIPLFSSCFPAALAVGPSTAPQAARAYEYAGFFPRLGAYVIDYLAMAAIIFAIAVMVGVLLAVATGRTEDPLSDETWNVIGAILGLIVGLAYYGYFTAGPWQATPGKRALGIYVIRADGERIGWGVATGRYLAYFLSAILLFYGFLMILWDDEKRGLHDIVCKTRVVKGAL
ncbi:RDD family protein [Methylocystis sp. S23]|jgi:uncharacterized RDD family membrane protein YckC